MSQIMESYSAQLYLWSKGLIPFSVTWVIYCSYLTILLQARGCNRFEIALLWMSSSSNYSVSLVFHTMRVSCPQSVVTYPHDIMPSGYLSELQTYQCYGQGYPYSQHFTFFVQSQTWET